MASDEAIRNAVMTRMEANYAQPKHVTDRALKRADYLAALRPFDIETLNAAWAVVVARHRYTTWPEPGIIAAACRQVLEGRGKKATPARAAVVARAQQHRAEDAADAAMMTDIGQEAIAEGWSRQLWLAVRDAGSLEKVDLGALKATRQALAEQVASWEGSPPSQVHSFGRTMIGRAEAAHAARFRRQA